MRLACILALLLLTSPVYAAPEIDEFSNRRITPGTTLSGERLPTQGTNSYLSIRNEANVQIISTVSTVTIGMGVAGDVHLLGVFLTAALTGTCVFTGFADTDGVAQSYTLPAATPAGFKDFLAARNTAGPLTILCSNAADDNLVMIFWRPAQ